MEQYTTRGPFEFSPERVEQIMVIRVDIGEMTGKVSGFDEQ
jgi:hypothetical protein